MNLLVAACIAGVGIMATPWLVACGREDLTLEHEIGQTRWRDLFAEEERVEAESPSVGVACPKVRAT